MTYTYLSGIRLPVNPLEEITFSCGTSNESFDVIAIGDVTEIGNRKQITVEIKSLFPNQQYPFMAGSNIDAEGCITIIKKIMESKKPVQFIITGDETDINMLCSINSFKYNQNFGEAGEYYYSLSLQEYREHKAKKVIIKNLAGNNNSANSSDSTDGAGVTGSASISSIPQRTEKEKSESFTTKASDVAWSAVKKATGSGDNAKAIAKDNGFGGMKKIPAGTTLKIDGSTTHGGNGGTFSNSTDYSAKRTAVAASHGGGGSSW